MTPKRHFCNMAQVNRILLVLLLSAPILSAQQAPPVAQFLSELIQRNTANPPGNEDLLAQYLAPIFKQAGFEVDIIATPQKGKSHFIARLRGNGTKKPVLLAAHADVVGVEREKWTVDPFAGTIRDGYVIGRGAIDFKGGLAVFAQAALDIARSKRELDRDIIFLSEADEEGGPYNTGWLAERHWDKIDCEFSLNEGGWIVQDEKTRKVKYVSVSTADKLSLNLILRAKGTSTHSSMPLADNAIFRLARALAKVGAYDTKPRLNDSTKLFFKTLGDVSEEPLKTQFYDLVAGADPAKLAAADKAISQNPLLHAIMRNTIAPTFLNAGFRGNVIPGSADATLNFRVIPGTTIGELIDEIQTLVNDPQVEVLEATTRLSNAVMTPEQQQAAVAAAKRPTVPESPLSSALYLAVAKHAKQTYPEAQVTPYLFQAGTDAYAWRSRGIPVYGIYPYPITAEDLTRMHGNDERIPVASLVSGLKMITNILLEVAAKH
ncbi:M20/M25/M40 family metallo-hydrolase [Bryobacter aggregatus]|uniref:M20/M25/M40 family metallo-hydrolase n=1 Tax=Bryobacter aggregatus TaxID=360054 RepID=UPI001EE1F51A|nr:M20/M25/M40 family metallo-hydrolase [Bryobacter aggregatus]